jgi:diguanylate cyclase (GGDEF)-like protein
MLEHIARVLRLTQFFALLLVIGLGSVLYSALVEFEKAQDWVDHTHEVIDGIAQVRLESLRSGIWLRNYMVAPQPVSLQRVHASADRAGLAAGHLVAITQDNPAQQQRLLGLQAELSRVLGQYRRSADMAQRDGPVAVQAIINTQVSNDSTHTLREMLDEAERIEQGLLQDRSRIQHERYTLFKRLLAGGSVAFAGIMLWAVLYSSRLVRSGRHQVRQLQVDALHDPLTGLLNRRGLEEHLAAMTGQAQQTNRHVAVLAFDLDDFKPVNDRHGHAAGDLVLQEIGERLRQQCRDGDAMARVGGDEFIVVLNAIRSRHEAQVIAQRISKRLRAPIRIEDASVRVGASIGVALLHEDGEDLSALLRAADEQMYAAKRSGKDMTVVSEPVSA